MDSKGIGIIYCAYNKISGKRYIGQTIQMLNDRITAHYVTAKRCTGYKFINALRLYNRDDWDWSIIEECDTNIIDEREIYWIKELDTFENGYNSTIGGNSLGYGKNYPKSKKKIFTMYHKDKGVITEIQSELALIIGCKPRVISALILGRRNSVFGWCNTKEESENARNTKELYTIINSSNTEHTGTLSELIAIVGNRGINGVTTGVRNSFRGWVLKQQKA